MASACNQNSSSREQGDTTSSEISDTNAVKNRIDKIVQEQFGWKEDVTVNLRLAEDLKGDSLDAVELVMAIEEEFGIEIADEAAEKMRTVGDVISYVEKAVDLKRQ